MVCFTFNPFGDQFQSWRRVVHCGVGCSLWREGPHHFYQDTNKACTRALAGSVVHIFHSPTQNMVICDNNNNILHLYRTFQETQGHLQIYVLHSVLIINAEVSSYMSIAIPTFLHKYSYHHYYIMIYTLSYNIITQILGNYLFTQILNSHYFITE